MFAHPLPDNAKPSLLFRAECSRNTSYRQGYMCARRPFYKDPPSQQKFDDHLSWNRKTPTRFLSFGTWERAIQRRQTLENKRETDIIVIAVWTENLPGVYSAERIAARLEYSDTGPNPRRRTWHHRGEYLVEGGIAAADEYRVLAIFEGGGPPRNVVFKYPSYRLSATLPSGFFPGRRAEDALGDIEDEIYSHSGVRDDTKRDRLVRAITGTPEFSLGRTIVPAK